MQRPTLLALAAAVALAGCTQFPDLEAAVSPEAKRADYPELVPAEGLLERRSDGRLRERDAEQLMARAENLKARAALLRGVSIDEDTRLRLAGRLRRLGG